MLRDPDVMAWAMKTYAETGSGPLATGVTGTGFFPHNAILTHIPDQKDFQTKIKQAGMMPVPGASAGLQKQHALSRASVLSPTEADIQLAYGPTGMNPAASSDISKLFSHEDPGRYLGIVTILTHAFSRGSIHIASADPLVPPIIDPRYLSHPVDVEMMALALRFSQVVARTPPMSDMLLDDEQGTGEKRIQPSFNLPPGPFSHDLAVQVARHGSMSSWHPVGTCSMLPQEDGGVVDERLRVYGVKGLRVVDASVIPLNVRGNIISTVYAVAERAADLVKEDWQTTSV